MTRTWVTPSTMTLVWLASVETTRVTSKPSSKSCLALLLFRSRSVMVPVLLAPLLVMVPPALLPVMVPQPLSLPAARRSDVVQLPLLPGLTLRRSTRSSMVGG